MRKNKFLTRLSVGALVVTVTAGSALLVDGVANAAPPGTLGTLAIVPATGTDLTPIGANTSGACPADADGKDDSYQVLIVGPIGSPNQTFPSATPFPIVTTTKAGFSTTDPINAQSANPLKDAARDASDPNYGGSGTLQTGEYDVTLRCINGARRTLFGTYTGAIFLTSPTTYTNTDPNATPTPTPTATPTPTPTATPAPGAVNTTTTLSVIQVPLPFGLGRFTIPIANLTPSNAVGTVQFTDNGNNIGRPVPVFGGITVGPFTTLRGGQHSMKAVFIPGNPAKFKSSTSNTVAFRF